MPRSSSAAMMLMAVMLPLHARPLEAAAQEAPPGPTLADLARLIEEQGRRLDEQAAQIKALREQIEQGAAAPSPSTLEERLAHLEQSVEKIPEVPPEVVATGEFPGSLRIPGTDAALRISGLVRMTAVNTFGPLGTEDRFVTSSIPVAGTPEAGKQARTVYTASPSRFGFDLRTPTGVGAMRAFIEGDFGGSGRTLRLRHAYGQWGPWVAGQTWSTFADPEAEPDTIDFEGLNAISLFRQPQIRFTHRFNEKVGLALALENPSPEITGTSGVSQVPDLIARFRWAPAKPPGPLGLLRQGSHIHAALLFRQIRGESTVVENATLSTVGYGVNFSGRLAAPGKARRAVLKYALYAGQGIGRYITDLGTLGGQDAVYDPATQTLETLPVFAAYVGFEQTWTSTLRSTVTYGYVRVDNLDIQPDDALRATNRGSINLSWSPISRIDLVAEYLLGNRINKDRKSGFSNQLQLGGNFRF
jgi:outer membrane DcaP-like protein